VQSTLLGLAIAIILAIVTALVAPLVVDWDHYRTQLEAEASRLTGLTVRVNGNIEARILPSPRLKLRNVEVGAPGKPPQISADSVDLELALGPLLRGQMRATDMRVVAPQIKLGLNRAGVVEWPSPSPNFRAEAITISHLVIENGRLILTDAGSGSRVVLQQLGFNGDIRSFAGPFMGDGAFVAGDKLYGYRISASRADDNSGLKLRLGIDPADYPLTADIEGTIAFTRGVPQFDGKLALARPVGAVIGHGERVLSDPWHLTGTIAATPASASLRDLALQYGPDERAINFSGKAQMAFGEHPHLDGLISAQDVDIDRAIANPDETHRPPFLMLRSFIEAFVAAVRPSLPADIGVSADAVSVGGNTIQSLQGGLRFDGRNWSLNDFKFHAPGFTEVEVSGRLDSTPQGFLFRGPADLQSGDAKMLMAWLEGSAGSPSGEAETLTAHGVVTVSNERLAIEQLSAALDQEKMEGRLAYAWALNDRPASLDGQLRAADLDIDALWAFAKAATSDSGFEVPHNVALALNISKATLAGIDVRNIDAQVKLDAGVLRVDRLAIGDVGGAALNVSGNIDELSSKPRGRLTLDLDANALSGLASIVGKFAPQASAAFRGFAERFVDRLAPAKLHAVLAVDHAAGTNATAKLDLAGQVGALRLALSGDAQGEPDHPGHASLHADAKVDGDDGGALLRLLGLDHVAAVDQLPGQLTISATGPLDGDLRINGLAAAGGFSATAGGTLRLAGEQAPSANLQLRASAADLGPLQTAMTGRTGAGIPVTATAKLAIAGTKFLFTGLSATSGKAVVRGRLALDVTTPLGIDGALEGDNIDAAVLSTTLLGISAAAPGATGVWSAEPIGAGAFGAGNGAVTFKIHHAALTPALVARDLTGVARFAPAVITVDDLDGSLAGGHLTGVLKFRHDSEAFAAEGHIEVAGADAAVVLDTDPKTLDGRLTMKVQGDSIGLSPAALIGSLHGSGTIMLADAHFAGMKAAAFDAAIAAADQHETIDAAQVRGAVSGAMQNGSLAVPQGSADITATGGQIRLANAVLPAEQGAELALGGVLDLNTDRIDARMTLSGKLGANALIRTRPELTITLTGPPTAPKRTLDTAALIGWLTLRGAERQTRLLEEIEVNRRNDMAEPVVRPQTPPMRSVSPGVAAETVPAPSSVPWLGARGFDRLHAESARAPEDSRLDSGGAASGASVSTSPAAPDIPLPPRAPSRTDGTASAVPTDPPRRHLAPSPKVPHASAPHSPLDLLFRSQN
jgi:uncharacterized protein involved in outer membrane biogenesis